LIAGRDNRTVGVRDIETGLRDAADPDRAAQEKRYLKSEIRHLGVGLPGIRRVVAAFAREHPDLRRPELLRLVRELWTVPVHERRVAAVELLARSGSLLEPVDLRLVERLIRRSKTWALVDPLAINVAGSLVERFPELADDLDRWAADRDFWIRRSALLALLRPLRRGEGDFRRFAAYADAMLEEREFFIRKAIGWVLRETGKARPAVVARWLRPRAARASGVTVREAVKYLPRADRESILQAHRSARVTTSRSDPSIR
jgi:3-methyladenine DNA glycosylase AlkD